MAHGLPSVSMLPEPAAIASKACTAPLRRGVYRLTQPGVVADADTASIEQTTASSSVSKNILQWHWNWSQDFASKRLEELEAVRPRHQSQDEDGRDTQAFINHLRTELVRTSEVIEALEGIVATGKGEQEAQTRPTDTGSIHKTMDAVALPSKPPDMPWNDRLERLDRNLNQYVRYELGEDTWARWPDIRNQKRFQAIHYKDLKYVLRHAKREGLCRYEFIETHMEEEEPTCEFRTRFMLPLPRGSKHNGNKRQRDDGVTMTNARRRRR